MKKHISVLMLMIRSSLYKVLLVLAGLGIADVIAFTVYLRRYSRVLPDLLDSSPLALLFKVALVLIVLILCPVGGEYGVRTGYTLRRLSISEGEVFLWQSLFNTGCFLLLWLVQALIGLGLGRFFTVFQSASNHQTLVLAAYQSDFLHSLLPMQNLLLWVRNGLWCLALGLSCAHFPYCQRRKKLSLWPGVLVVMSFIFFFPVTGTNITPTTLLLVASGFSILLTGTSVIFGEEVPYEDEAAE